MVVAVIGSVGTIAATIRPTDHTPTSATCHTRTLAPLAANPASRAAAPSARTTIATSIAVPRSDSA